MKNESFSSALFSLSSFCLSTGFVFLVVDLFLYTCLYLSPSLGQLNWFLSP